MSEPQTKRCPNCLHEHSRKARACCDECARRIRSHRSVVTAGRNRVQRGTMAAIIKRDRHTSTWRAVAMTADPRQLLMKVFGTEPRGGGCEQE